MLQNNAQYHTESAVLFIFFNRTDTTLKVLEQIKQVRPKRFYLTCDGPRLDRENEKDQCMNARKAVLEAIDWECEVNTLFRDENVGSKEAISSAVDWFFRSEESGIILEHDCLPNPDFFYFCDTMLEKYRDDKRIWLISGGNLNGGKKFGNATYYFSNLTNGWGWATWKRSWDTYDKNLSAYRKDEVREQLEKIFSNPLIIDRLVEIFNDTKDGKIDTWDYQVTFIQFFTHSLSIVPNYNLISNIGFGELAVNTANADSPFANVPLEKLPEMIHPRYMLPEKGADTAVLFEEFNIKGKMAYLKKHNSFRKRFQRWLKGM